MPNYVSKIKPNGLGGTEYTIKDAELREVVQAMQDEVAGTQTATGNPITLTDGSETYAQGLTVELEPKQDLHGYDFPWVGGAGKNKLPLTVEGIKVANTSGTWSGNVYTLNGVTFTIQTDDGGNVSGITISGHATDGINFFVASNLILTSASILNLSSDKNTTNNDADFYVGGIGIGSSNWIDGSANISADTYQTIGIYLNTNYNDTITIHPMIRLSTETDPTFAPYSNICPISGYEWVEVEDVGNNLFDKDSADNVTGYWINTNNGTLEPSSSGWNTSGYIRVEPSTTYSFTVESSAIDICCFDEAKTFISGVVRQSITTPQNCVYIRFDYKESEKNYVQLEKGPTRTPYEPFKSRTASVTFGQTVYGGRSDFTEGGTENTRYYKKNLKDLDWAADTAYSTHAFYALSMDLPVPKNADTSAITSIMSDRYKADSVYRIDRGYDGICEIKHSTGMRIWICDSRYDNVTDFKNSLEDCEICYEVETHTTISTPPTDLKLLQDTNNLTTNGTTITLDYIPNNSIGDAVKASEEYTDRVVERVAVVPKATLIDTWMISEEADTISVDLSSYDCNFFLLEYLFQSKRGTTLIPRPQGGSFSASVVTYNNGTPYYIELDYNPTTKELAYTSNVTSQFGILAIYTI